MLRLNASVHSWLTRQEMKLAKARAQAHAEAQAQAPIDEQHQQAAAAGHDSATQMDELHNDEEELLHAQLKNEVGDMYSVWDEADARLVVCILWYECMRESTVGTKVTPDQRPYNQFLPVKLACDETPLSIFGEHASYLLASTCSVCVYLPRAAQQPLPHSHAHAHTHTSDKGTQ